MQVFNWHKNITLFGFVLEKPWQNWSRDLLCMSVVWIMALFIYQREYESLWAEATVVLHTEISLIKTKHTIYLWQKQMSALLLQIKVCLVPSPAFSALQRNHCGCSRGCLLVNLSLWLLSSETRTHKPSHTQQKGMSELLSSLTLL